MSRSDRTRFAVLGLLADGEKSGYDLKSEFEQRLSYFWAESVGQIYPALHRLRADGFATSRKSRDGARGRTVYRITARGREALRGWLSEPPSREQVRNEMALKLYLGASAGRDVMLDHLEHYEASLCRSRDHYRAMVDVIEQQPVSEETKVFWRLTLDSGREINAARLRWCRRARRTLATETGARS